MIPAAPVTNFTPDAHLHLLQGGPLGRVFGEQAADEVLEVVRHEGLVGEDEGRGPDLAVELHAVAPVEGEAPVHEGEEGDPQGPQVRCLEGDN